jgi:predicted component of viral defense system (DUF524 family)
MLVFQIKLWGAKTKEASDEKAEAFNAINKNLDDAQKALKAWDSRFKNDKALHDNLDKIMPRVDSIKAEINKQKDNLTKEEMLEIAKLSINAKGVVIAPIFNPLATKDFKFKELDEIELMLKDKDGL